MNPIVIKCILYVRIYNDKNYKENCWILEKVTQKQIVALLKVEIPSRRTSKTEPVWQSYDFYKRILILKYKLKNKLSISQNDQEEGCRVHRDLHGYIRVNENEVHRRELWIFKDYKTFSPHPRTACDVHSDTLIR